MKHLMIQRIWFLVKVVFACILVGIIFSRTNLEEFAQSWSRMSLVWLFPSIALYIVILVVMAWRSWLLSNRSVPFRAMLTVTAIQTTLGNLVANAAGMASFVTMLRVRYQYRVASGIGIIIITKMFDMAIFLALLAIGLFIVYDRVQSIYSQILLLMGILFGCFLVVLLALLWKNPIIHVLQSIYSMTAAGKHSIFRPIGVVLENMRLLDYDWNVKIIAMTLTPSLLNVVLVLLFSYVNYELLGMPLSIGSLIFFTAASMIISWIPVSVFGGIGVYEMSSLLLLTLLGYPEAQVIPLLIGSRIYATLLNLTMVPFVLSERRQLERGIDASSEIVVL